MTEYKVAWHQVTLPTGQLHHISKQQYTRSYERGEIVDSEEYGSEEWGDKVDRLVERGALVDRDAALPDPEPFVSAMDIPLTHSGDEDTSVRVEVDTENDDLDDDEEETPVVQLERPALNASADVWRAYARAANVEVPDLETAKRDEIVAAVDFAQQGK